MERYQEVMVALSESVIKHRLKRPLAEKSRWPHIRLSLWPRFLRKPCIPDKKLLWNTNRKSWSLFQNSSWKTAWSAPQMAKSRWRDILFVIKARNHTSQIKSYYGSLSGSIDRLVIFIKKQQKLIQKTYQLNVVNGVSHSHKTANIFFFHLT